MDDERYFPKPSRRDLSGEPVERDELGRAHICIQCMKAVKPWGPCYQQGHEVAPIQNLPECMNAN
jgi:hypothetical protein